MIQKGISRNRSARRRKYAACRLRGKDPVESLHESMEKAVQAENRFKRAENIRKIGEKEHQLYDSAVKLNMDDYQKIVTLSDQALSNANQRKTSESRKDSIDDSKQAFESAKTSQEIKDKKVKEKAGHAVALMEKRYASYDLLYKKYEKPFHLIRTFIN